jgi:hypothetical protein
MTEGIGRVTDGGSLGTSAQTREGAGSYLAIRSHDSAPITFLTSSCPGGTI